MEDYIVWLLISFVALMFLAGFFGASFGLWLRLKILLKDDRVKAYKEALRRMGVDGLLKEVYGYGKKGL